MTDETGGHRPDNNSGLGADADDEVDETFPPPSGEPSESVRIIGPVDEPPLRFRPDDTGPLPHWTEPPTGEVPKIFGDDVAAGDDEAVDPWSGVGGAPVWREDKPGFDDATIDIDFTALGAGTQIGALDEQGTSSVDPFFDDEAYAPEPEQSRVTPIRTRRLAGPVAASRPTVDEVGHQPGGVSGRDLPMAVGVGIAIGAVAWVLLALGARFAMALVVVAAVVCGVEFYDKLREKGYQPATLAGLVAIAALPLAGYWKGVAGLPLVSFLAVVVTLVWFILAPGIESGPLPNTAVTLLGVSYIGLLGAFGALILQFPNGTGTFFTLILGTIAYDIGGLFVGSSAGRTPLVAWISPNKTVEGLIGGMLAAFLVVILVHFFGLHPWGGDGTSLAHAVELGVVIAVAAPLGDLAESMIKRNLDIKDFGTVLPGHGGALDRFDTFLFVLPSVYYLSLVVKVV